MTNRWLLSIFLSFGLSHQSWADVVGGGVKSITESDGAPTCFPWQLVVSNTTLTDNADGTCSVTTGGGGGDNITVNTTAATDANFLNGDIDWTLNTATSPNDITATVGCADCVALTTETSGNYAAGDAEAGAALTGDSATSFFSTGTLEVGIGGSGGTTFTDGGILLGSGTGAFTALGVATNGQIPIGDGTTDPVLATITGTANQITVTNGAGSITLATPQDIATTSDVTFGNLILSGNAGPDIRWTPTGGNTLHLGAEVAAGNTLLFLSNVTTGTHWMRFFGTNVQLPTLTNCNTLDTTADGRLTCGTDETAAAGSGDITDVWNCTTGNCNALTAAAGDSLNAASADTSDPFTESTSTGGTAEGQCHWETDTDWLTCGTGTAAKTVSAKYTYFAYGSAVLTSTFWMAPGIAPSTSETARDEFSALETCTASTLYTEVATAPGAGNSWTVCVNVNGTVLTEPCCAIADTATSCNETVGTGTVTGAQSLNVEFLEAGTAVDGGRAAFGFLCTP